MVFCLVVWFGVNLFVTIFLCSILFREVLLPHCRFKGYNAIKYLIPDTQNVDAAWSAWQGVFLEILYKHVPLKPITIRPNNNVWMTSALHKLSHKNIASSPQPNVRSLPRPGKLTSKPETCATLHSKKQNRHSWSSSRTNFLHWLTAAACGGARQRLSQGLAHLPKQISNLTSNGQTLTQPKEKADALAKYFAQQCTAPATDKEWLWIWPLSCTLPSSRKPADLQLPSHSAAHGAPPSSPSFTDKSTADQVMTNRVLRECASSITESVTYLFNLSVSTGTFPSAWKCDRHPSI